MDSQKDEFENLKVLDRKTKEFEIIKQISSNKQNARRQSNCLSYVKCNGRVFWI